MAYQVPAGNPRKIDSFMKKISQIETPQTSGPRVRQRRPTMDPIQNWLPLDYSSRLSGVGRGKMIEGSGLFRA